MGYFCFCAALVLTNEESRLFGFVDFLDQPKESEVSNARDLMTVYRLYRKHHGPIYSAWIARQIVLNGTPF